MRDFELEPTIHCPYCEYDLGFADSWNVCKDSETWECPQCNRTCDLEILTETTYSTYSIHDRNTIK